MHPRLQIDIPRLFASRFNASASRQPLAWMVGHKLWYRSWHQVPAASLPDDDGELCHLGELGSDLKSFAKVRDLALWGWRPCADGRLYHPVVAEAALFVWLETLGQRLSGGRGNARRWGSAFDGQQLEEQIGDAVQMLRRLNPGSEAIKRALERLEGRSSRTRIGDGSHPDRTPIAPRSQGDRDPIAPRIGVVSQVERREEEESLPGGTVERFPTRAHAHAREAGR